MNSASDLCAAFLGSAIFLVAPPGMVAADPAGGPQPIPGYFDSKTHIFTPLPPSPPATAAAAPVVRQGRIVIHATIAIEPSIPPATAISAVGSMSVSDAKFQSSAGASGDVTRTGNTGTVTISFFYRLEAAGTDMMKVQINISPATSTGPSLNLTQTIPLPADGATTVVNFPAAL